MTAWYVRADGYTVVRMRAAGVRVGKRSLPKHGRYGFLHVVPFDVAAELVRRRLANSTASLRVLEDLVALHQRDP